MVIKSILEGFLGILPSEISSKIDLLVILIEALGGLLFIYIVLMVSRFFMIKKQREIIDEIRSDVKFIKNNLKPRKK